MKTNRTRPNRRGVTLLHMLFVMTLVAGLLASATILISQVMDAELVMRNDVQWTNLAVQLDEQIRNDVHSAISVDTSEEELLLRLKNGGRVTYEVRPTNSTTELWRREFTASGEVVTQDSYAIPFDSEITWARIDGPSGGIFVDYQVKKKKGPAGPSRRLFHVVAAVGSMPPIGDQR